MKTISEIQLLEKQADLYWKDVCREADTYRGSLKNVNWQQLLTITALTTVYGVADNIWKVEEGDETLGVSHDSLKNLLLDLIRMKLEENLQDN